MTPRQIVDRARECLGTPFKHQGRLPGIALDCAGLAAYVAQGWHEVIEPAAYGRTPHDAQLKAWVELQPYLVRTTEAMAGDLLLMRFTREPQHLGVCAGETLIHSYQSAGKVVEHNIDAVWRRRIVAVYRFESLES
jgi:cell wall-associated NlpC family hydrolase